MGLQSASHGVHVCVTSVEAESRLAGTVAFVEIHVAPSLVRPIRFHCLQLCCLGARMVGQPLLPTASKLGTHLHLPFRPCQRALPRPWAATEALRPPTAGEILTFLEATKNGATYYMYIYICYVYYVVYTMLYTYYIYSITTIWMYIWKYMNVNNILNLYMKVYECMYETIWKYMNVYSVCKYTQVYEYILCVLCSI